MNIDYKLVGKRIKSAREIRKITQFELAEKADLSFQYVSVIELGKKRPSLDALIRIANALSTTVDELLGDTVDKNTLSFDSDLKILMSDCNKFEKQVMYENAVALKKIIKNNRVLLKQEEFE